MRLCKPVEDRGGGGCPGLAYLGVFVCAYFHTVVRVQQQKSKRAAESNCERGELLFPITIIIAAQTRKGAAFGLEGHGKKTESTTAHDGSSTECARMLLLHVAAATEKAVRRTHTSGEEGKDALRGPLACEGLGILRVQSDYLPT